VSNERRLLILAEGFSDDAHFGKTAHGVLRYRPQEVVAILDSERAGKTHEGGFPVVGTAFGALAYEPNTALVGVVTQGGRFPPEWRDLLKDCITRGLDIENGLHEFITDDPELSELAALNGVTLRDLRKPPAGLNVPTGENLTHDSKVVRTVGSDCAIGKMTVALELDAESRRRGIKSEFVPTGQTGIAIAGWGIAVDAVVSDFVAGAAERLVLEGVDRGGELLFVEGQGSLLHPAYSGVTLGLLHGSAPHALVLAHEAGVTEFDDFPGVPILPLAEIVDIYERLAAPVRPARVLAISLNTRRLKDDDEARAAIAQVESETGLPCDDPVRFGPEALWRALAAGLHGLGGAR
jgi:uncharacterized NAD-dependent epimerase/dehydratase family protein